MAIALAITATATGKLVMAANIALDSDNAQQAMVFYDMAGNGNHLLRGWYLPVNSYLLTDYPFNFLTGLLMGMSPLTLKLAAFLIFALGTIFLSVAMGRAFGARTGMVTALAVLSLPAYTYTYLLQPCLHNGTVTMSFLLLLLYLEFTRGWRTMGYRGRAMLLAAFFTVALLTAFSDLYLLAFLAAPLVMALAGLAVLKMPRHEYRPHLILLALLAAAIGLGAYTTKLPELFGLHLTGVPMAGVGAGDIAERLKTFVLRVMMTLSGNGGTGEPIAFVNLILLTVSIYAAVAILKREADHGQRFAIAFFFSLIAVLSLAVTFKSYNPYRYLVPAAYPFAVLAALALTNTEWLRSAIGKRVFVLSCTLSAALSLAASLSHRPPQEHTELAAVLEKNGLTYGYSEYWDANITTLLSGDRVRVRSVRRDVGSGQIGPYFWFSNASWYHPSRIKGATFIIAKDSEPAWIDAVTRQFGPPSRVLHAEGRTVLVWPYNILRKSLSVRLSDNAPMLIGRDEPSPEGAYRVAEMGQAGKLVFSKPWPLYKGRYRAVFTIRADITAESPGSVAVFSGKDAIPQAAASLTLPGNAGEADYAIDFTSTGEDFVFVVSTNGAARLEARSILIESY